MTVHFLREMDQVKSQIMRLGTLVEEQLYHAIKAVENLDVALAEAVIVKDDRVDQMEVEIEEDCLKILALYQPVAIDLRLMIAVLKMNSDLERVGDIAVNIAETVRPLQNTEEESRRSFDFHIMAEKVRQQFRKSLDALINLDEKVAQEVCAKDVEVDELYRETCRTIEQMIIQNPQRVSALMRYLSISRSLERVGDHATNIAEDVLYMVKGRIFRHIH